MVLKRELRTRFDLYRPCADTVTVKQLAQVAARKGSSKVTFKTGDTVMVDDFSVRSEKRREGTIVRKLSPVTFEVEVEPNKVWKRHVDQIVKLKKKDHEPRDLR